MRPLIQQLIEQSTGTWATILVVGAGNGAELPLLRQLEGGRLILAEAHPGQAEALARRIDPEQGEEVWPQAVTPASAEQAALHIVNNLAFSSLKRPAGLCEHFPNLREIQQVSVPARSLSDSLDQLALDGEGDHLLILDAPGLTFDLLSTTASDALQRFSRIIVRCGVEPLYADDKTMKDVVGVLRDIGFDAGDEDPEAIYPQTAMLLARNDARVEKSCLESLVAQASAQCEAQTRLANERAKEIERLTRDREHAVEKYKSELDKATQVAAEQQKQLSERDTQLQQLAQERDAQIKLAGARKSEQDKATQVAAEQQKQLSERDTQLQQLAQERDAQIKLAGERKAELDKAMEGATGLQSQVAKLDEHIKKLDKQLLERNARVSELEGNLTRLDQHQAWLDREVVKSEAQVDLIKEILLREQAI